MNFALGQKVRIAEGCTNGGMVGEIIKLPRKVRVYRVRFESGEEGTYFYTRLTAVDEADAP